MLLVQGRPAASRADLSLPQGSQPQAYLFSLLLLGTMPELKGVSCAFTSPVGSMLTGTDLKELTD